VENTCIVQTGGAHRLDKTGVAEGEPNKPRHPLVGGAGCVNKSYDSLN